MTETQLQSLTVDAAGKLGYDEKYHTHDSRHSAKGFPDEVFAHRGKARLVFMEFKSADGQVTPEQAHWHDTLAMCDQEIYVVRPEHWESGEVVEILSLPEKPSKAVRACFDSAVVFIGV